MSLRPDQDVQIIGAAFLLVAFAVGSVVAGIVMAFWKGIL